MNSPLRQEPAVIVSTVTAFLTAIVGLGAAFGLGITDAQQNAVIATVAPVAALIFLIGFAIRGTVWSPDAKQNAVDHAYTNGLTDAPPPVNPPT